MSPNKHIKILFIFWINEVHVILIFQISLFFPSFHENIKENKVDNHVYESLQGKYSISTRNETI